MFIPGIRLYTRTCVRGHIIIAVLCVIPLCILDLPIRIAVDSRGPMAFIFRVIRRSKF